jgi:hypothetical protein
MGATHDAHRSVSGFVGLEFISEHLRDLAGAFQSLGGELPDDIEMKAIFEAGLPVAVLFSFFAGEGNFGHAFALQGKLNGLQEQAGDAKVVEIDGVSEKAGIVHDGGALVDFLQEAGGAVEKRFRDIRGEKSD